MRRLLLGTLVNSFKVPEMSTVHIQWAPGLYLMLPDEFRGLGRACESATLTLSRRFSRQQVGARVKSVLTASLNGVSQGLGWASCAGYVVLGSALSTVTETLSKYLCVYNEKAINYEPSLVAECEHLTSRSAPQISCLKDRSNTVTVEEIRGDSVATSVRATRARSGTFKRAAPSET